MGADLPDLFLGPSQLGRADLTCSLRMMLVMEGTRKEKKGLESFLFIFNLVDFLKSLVATAYVGCTAICPTRRSSDLRVRPTAVFVGWVSKDGQLTNSAVLSGQLHFFFHQVFETDGC